MSEDTNEILEKFHSDPRYSFEVRRVISVGDIALDRTWQGRESHTHAIQRDGTNAERQYDIDQDDDGSVGGIFTTNLICASFGIPSSLVTLHGNDDEGKIIDRRIEATAEQFGGRIESLIHTVDTHTVTRWRFIDSRPNHNRLMYRFNKEPDYQRSYRSAETWTETDAFKNWLAARLGETDCVVVNDIEKGFLSSEKGFE